MLLGYVRVSKADGSQSTDLQKDALKKAGVLEKDMYEDRASGKKEDRPQLLACLKALREGDTLIVWKLDRLGRDLNHLIQIIKDLQERQINFKVLTGQGADIDTSTSSGRLIFGIFASIAEYERALIVERTNAGLASARARGRIGGRSFKMSTHKLYMAQAAMGKPQTEVNKLCKELGITRQTLYRHVAPDGEFRSDALKLLAAK